MDTAMTDGDDKDQGREDRGCAGETVGGLESILDDILLLYFADLHD